MIAECSHAVQSKQVDYLTLLRCIVRVDQAKLMSRLRSRHAKRTRKTSNRQPPLVQLQKALNDPSIHTTRALRQADLDGLRAKAGHLESLFTQIETMMITEATVNELINRLLELVQATESFALNSLSTLISALDLSRVLDPSTKEYLPVAIEKLARYSQASQYLVAIARNKRYSVFTRVNVEVVSFPCPTQSLFQGPYSTLEQAAQIVTMANIPAKKRKIVPPVRSFLGLSYDTKAKEFQARVNSRKDDWKVHAEIQLLAYHELNPERSKPRIIASSKSACYLCNLFVGLHGQFLVPRTHGRIYDLWVFPDWVDFPQKQRDRVNVALEQFDISIQQSIINTLRARRRSLNHPNESVVFPVRQLSSSTLSNAQLTTPLATPPSSQMSLAPQIMQVKSARTTQVSIAPMDTIAEHEVLRTATPGSVSAMTAVPSEQQGILQAPMNENTDSGSVLTKPVAEEEHLEENSDRSLVEAEAGAPILQEQHRASSLLHTTPEESRQEEFIQDSFSQSRHSHLSESDRPSTATASTSSDLPEHTLTHPGQAVSCPLASPTSEISVRAGKLHLTLSRDLPQPVPPPSETPHPPSTHTVTVKRLDERAYRRRVGASDQPHEVISGPHIAEGEALTVERGGWRSEHDLVVSCGRDTWVVVRYGIGGLEG